MNNFSIEINSKFLIDFAKYVEKSTKNPDYIYIAQDEGALYFFTKTYDSTVSLKIPEVSGKNMMVAVKASEFINTMKRFNEDQLSITISKSKVKLSLGNATVSYSTAKADMDLPVVFEGEPLREDPLTWFLESLVKCADSVSTILKDDSRFQDIFFWNTTNTYMTRFTEAAIRICAAPYSIFGGRVVIPSASAKVAKAFKSSITECRVGQNFLTFEIKQHKATLQTTFFTLVDNYLKDCLAFLKLNNTLPLIDGGDFYTFNRDHLLQALDLVSSTIGDDSQVKFEIVGRQDGGNPVWKLSSSNFKGSFCEELVAGTETLTAVIDPFYLHGKKTIKALESYGETVSLRNHSQSTIALIGDDPNDLTLLSKGNG